MKSSSYWLLILVVFFTGCGVTPQKYTFETIQPDDTHVTFHAVTTQDKNGTVVLHGSLFQKPYRSSHQSGHIDIAVYSPTGELIINTTAGYRNPINPAYAWYRTGVRFFTPLSLVPPSGSIIKMAFHVNQQRQPLETHGLNIAL